MTFVDKGGRSLRDPLIILSNIPSSILILKELCMDESKWFLQATSSEDVKIFVSGIFVMASKINEKNQVLFCWIHIHLELNKTFDTISKKSVREESRSNISMWRQKMTDYPSLFFIGFLSHSSSPHPSFLWRQNFFSDFLHVQDYI